MLPALSAELALHQGEFIEAAPPSVPRNQQFLAATAHSRATPLTAPPRTLTSHSFLFVVRTILI